MGQVIGEQVRFFLQAVGAGLFLRCWYDVLLLWRRIRKHSFFWIGIEDMIYWFCCCLFVFSLFYRENDGIIRGFVLFGVFLGMLIYHKGPSEYVVEGGFRIWNMIQKAIRAIGKVILMPFRLIMKIWNKIWKKHLQKYKNCFKLKKPSYKKKRNKQGEKNIEEKGSSSRRIKKKIRKETIDFGSPGIGSGILRNQDSKHIITGEAAGKSDKDRRNRKGNC